MIYYFGLNNRLYFKLTNQINQPNQPYETFPSYLIGGVCLWLKDTQVLTAFLFYFNS